MQIDATKQYLPEWSIGPFEKYDKNPVLSPTTGFESWTVYNPAVIVKDGRFCMVYRAEAVEGKGTPYAGTSQLGLAMSDDGINWERYEGNPIMAATEEYEMPGGCEDPRLVRHGGIYYLTYTGYYWPHDVRVCLATSTDLIHWEKQGPMFPEMRNTKSGCIVQNPEGEAVKVNGRYVMYMNHHIAYSDDFIQWEVKEFERGLSGEVCVAITDYRASGRDDILVFYAGSLKGEVANVDWYYAISESLYSRQNPEKLLAVLSEPVLKPESAFEKDPARLDENGAKGTLFMDSIIRHDGRWWVHYGASDKYIGLATAKAT